jgi:hypothetical protein
MHSLLMKSLTDSPTLSSQRSTMNLPLKTFKLKLAFSMPTHSLSPPYLVHLGIIITQVEYSCISGTHLAEPFDPGTISLIANGTYPVNAAQIMRLHDEFRRAHTTRGNANQALKRIILEAYNNMYTSQLEDYLLQYTNRSALDILVHLKTTYGFINTTQLTEK